MKYKVSGLERYDDCCTRMVLIIVFIGAFIFGVLYTLGIIK